MEINSKAKEKLKRANIQLLNGSFKRNLYLLQLKEIDAIYNHLRDFGGFSDLLHKYCAQSHQVSW
jgi:hypothetical protein